MYIKPYASKLNPNGRNVNLQQQQQQQQHLPQHIFPPFNAMAETKTTVQSLPSEYKLIDTCAPVDDFHHLRSVAAVLQVTKPQIATSIEHTWYGCHITYTDPSSPDSKPTVVGMGRAMNGGWVFHVVDMVVLPEHQRRGLGDVVFKRILKEIESRAPPGPTLITLMADPPAQKLYARNGFSDTPAALGMRRIMDVPIRGSNGA
jgi:GNAT superfamily N-acetyltransferase